MTDDQQKDIELSEELLTILSNLLDHGNWDNSLFLKVSKKRLESLRTDAKALLNELNEHSMVVPGRPKLERSGHERLFVTLYFSGQADLKHWEQVLSTLSAYVIGRPVYGDEAHAEEALRLKGYPDNEAYVVVLVQKENILPIPEEKMIKDKQGHSLLTLKVDAIQNECIIEFVCAHKRYYVQDGKLILQNDA